MHSHLRNGHPKINVDDHNLGHDLPPALCEVSAQWLRAELY